MLEEKLTPVLEFLRAEGRDEKEKYAFVKLWFDEHTENLAKDLVDMLFVCKLPRSKRVFVTYPVIGNWFLEGLKKYNSKNDYQAELYSLLRNLVLETRFNNPHMSELYERHEKFNADFDHFHSLMLSKPRESMRLHKLMEGIARKAGSKMQGRFREKYIKEQDLYDTDPGHGIFQPIGAFSYLTWYLEAAKEEGKIKSLNLTVMVIDDACPKNWYNRLIAMGFKEPVGEGIFFDCESALNALKNGSYDVILTDLELGEGKMDGIRFAELAYDIQKEKGTEPRIGVFSYNDEKLEKAKEILGLQNGNFPNPGKKIFYNENKLEFTAANFRFEIRLQLGRERNGKA